MIAAPPPFLRHGDPGRTPLVVSVPHAGRFYPPAIADACAVPHAVLEQIEDRHADRLIGPLLADGAVAIVATHARAWIDLNRHEADRGSARERGGLGLVPSRLAGRDLWRAPPASADVAARVAAVHRPYHAAIADAIDAAMACHGHVLLIDCHSMPPLGRARGGARIVIGDRHGSSAGEGIAAAAATVVERHRLAVARNVPYAGAYTLERHGRPRSHVHAIQIEVDRSLYLDAMLRIPAEGVGRIGMLLADMAGAMLAVASSAIATAFPQAAE